jgi:phage baseplate assembly protein V
MIEQLNRLLRPLRTRVDNIVARALVRLIKDDKKLQELQLEVLKGELRDRCERFQNYGFTSHPKPGATAVVLFVGGNRDHPLVVAVDDPRYRKLGLAEGEVAIYTDEGDFILLKRGREIQVTAGTKVKVTAPTVEVEASIKCKVTAPLTEIIGNATISGTLQVGGLITGQGGLAMSGGVGAAATITGNVTVTSGNVTADGIGLKTHVHGGVQAGGSNTGGPSG